MSKENIFQSKEPMVNPNICDCQVQTALSLEERREYQRPISVPDYRASVQNVTRPVRGSKF